ncbi:MAG TPA: methyltransferase domain-containing protein [Streptosporangiaceae bacterium]
MTEHECRACSGQSGHVVLDLGEQPACDYFPKYDEPGPDPVYPLRMWLCSACGLAQLLEDPTVPEEPKGAEPVALVEQAEDAVRRVAAAGMLPPGARVAEYGSPHGGSWLGMLADRGLRPVTDGAADIILDCFGMMHSADQAAAVAERAARLAPGGVLLLQYHSLHTIVTQGQWNALRHGHYAYYSTTALTRMLSAAGLLPVTSWRFGLYGGTVLLAARRGQDDYGGPDDSIAALLAAEEDDGITDPAAVSGLQRDASARAEGLREWLAAMRMAGQVVFGYSAASRAVALLRKAGVDRDLLPLVADASPSKHGLRMPGTSIPVVSPTELARRGPDVVVLFVPDLMPEVRKAYPGIEAAGAQWLDADTLGGRGNGHG